NPVTSETAVTGTPAAASAPAVEPDETIEAPAATSRRPSSSRPALSKTETSVRRTGRTPGSRRALIALAPPPGVPPECALVCPPRPTGPRPALGRPGGTGDAPRPGSGREASARRRPPGPERLPAARRDRGPPGHRPGGRS